METQEPNNESYDTRRCRHHGRKPKAAWIFLGILGAGALFTLFGFGLMFLWNALMPAIFHLGAITFWQAVGLAVLGRLVFGGLHRGPAGHFRRHHHMRMHRREACAETAA